MPERPWYLSRKSSVVLALLDAAVPDCFVESLCLILLNLLGFVLGLLNVKELRAELLAENQLVVRVVVRYFRH